MSMHPFDLRTALLAKHAQHVVLIHFPIALYFVGVLFDVLSLGKKKSTLSAAAYYNLALAALSTVPVVVTGLLAWRFALEGQALKGILLFHLSLALASSVLIVVTWWIHRQARRSAGEFLPLGRLPVEILTVALVALTGHLGGFLSGVNV
jgi:uncharacterized membrane protein